MKPAILLTLLALAAPATARADLVFKCKSVVFADQLSANLRFEENGQGGQIELDYWNGYPPIGLVYGELNSPKTKGALTAYPATKDAHSGYAAELIVPNGYLTADDFRAVVGLTKGQGAKKNYELNCNRF